MFHGARVNGNSFLLSCISDLFFRGLSPNVSFTDILRGFAQSLGTYACASDAVVFLYDPAHYSVTVPVVWAQDRSAEKVIEEGISLRLTYRGTLAEVLNGSKRLFKVEPNGDGLLHLGEMSVKAARTAVLIPMLVSETPIGCIFLAWPSVKGDDERGLTQDFKNQGAASATEKSALRGIPSSVLLRAAEAAGAFVAQHRHLTELAHSEETYRTLIEDASDLVFSLDAGERFTFVNRRSIDILGLKPKELTGVFYGDILTTETWERTCKVLDSARRDRSERVFYEWQVAENGAELEVHSTIIWRHGAIRGQQAIARDVTEKRRMEREIAKRKKELELSEKRRLEMKEFLSVATRAQEEERKRIARELHDDTAQSLLVLSRQLESVQGELFLNPEMAKWRLEELKNMTDDSIKNLRRFTRDLRPPVLDDFGLVAAIEGLLSSQSERGEREKTHAHVTFNVKGEPCRLDSATETALFRIAQEAYNNAVFHSGARTISIQIEFLAESVFLSVKDDGKGFEANKSSITLASKGRYGLIGMHERADLLGATLNIQSKPGTGTIVSVSVPRESLRENFFTETS